MEESPLKRPRMVAFPSHGNHFHNPHLFNHHHHYHTYHDQRHPHYTPSTWASRGGPSHDGHQHQPGPQLPHRYHHHDHQNQRTHIKNTHLVRQEHSSSTSNLLQLPHSSRRNHHHGHQTHTTDIDVVRTKVSDVLMAIGKFHGATDISAKTTTVHDLSHQRECLHKLLVLIKYHPPSRTCHCQPKILDWIVQQWMIVHLIKHQIKFNHHNRMLSPSEEQQHTGIDNRHQSGSQTTRKDIIDLWIVVLDIFYRYCPELTSEGTISKDFPEILQILHTVLEQETALRKEQDDQHNQTGTFVTKSENLLSIVSILHCCSGCSIGTKLIIQHPSTLRILVQILQASNHGQGCYLVQQEVLGVLKNLTYFGEEYRRNIVEEPNMIEALTSVADVAPNHKTLERLSAVVRNLALSTDVRLLLAQRPDILTVIGRLATLSGTDVHLSAREGDDSCRKHILRNVLSTLSSVAMDANSALPVILHGDGIIVDMLHRFLSYKDDSVVRKRSARTLRQLARDSTILVLLREVQMIGSLLHVALNDKNIEVQTEATETLAGFCCLIRSPMIQQTAILDALIQISKHKPSASASKQNILARALDEHTRCPDNLEAVMQRGELIRFLLEILKSSQATIITKKHACVTLMNLSENELNSQMLSQPSILEALVDILGKSESNQYESEESAVRAMIERNEASLRDDSVRVLLNLAKFPTNWTILAQQTNLLPSLVRLALSSSVEDNLKKRLKSTILALAAEI